MQTSRRFGLAAAIGVACFAWACDGSYRAPCRIGEEREVVPAPFAPPPTFGGGRVRTTVREGAIRVISLRLQSVGVPGPGAAAPGSIFELATIDADGALSERATIPLPTAGASSTGADWTGAGVAYLSRSEGPVGDTGSTASALRVNFVAASGEQQWSVELGSSRCVDCLLRGALRAQEGRITVLFQTSTLPGSGGSLAEPQVGYALLDAEGAILAEAEPSCAGGSGAQPEQWAHSAQEAFTFLPSGMQTVVCDRDLKPLSGALSLDPGGVGWWDEVSGEATVAWTEGTSLVLTRLSGAGEERVPARRISSAESVHAAAATRQLDAALFSDRTGLYFAASGKDGQKLGGDVRLQTVLPDDPAPAGFAGARMAPTAPGAFSILSPVDGALRFQRVACEL